MPETYYDSAEGVTITRERALQEVRDHGCDVAEFIAAVSPDANGTYSAQSVLDWLGY